MNQIFAKILADYKKGAQKFKQTIIAKYGFATEAELFAMLGVEQKPKAAKARLVKTSSGKKPVVYLVDILDASGSMSGEKIANACKAINEGISEFKKETSVDYKYTLVSFSGSGDLKTHSLAMPIYLVDNINKIGTRNMTALYEAVGSVLESIKNVIKTGEKVLVKIYTDGQENASRGKFKNPTVLSAFIDELEGLGFTVTFIGTKNDVLSVVKNINIKLSNTLAYDGTAKGLLNSMSFANEATRSYSKAVSEGLDVKENFFTKQTGKL